MIVFMLLMLIAANGFGLGEVGDFNHKTSYEAPMFKYSKNCPTKH